MNQIDFKAINDQIEALENKRTKFKVAGICCGVGAIFPIWAGAFGPFFFLAWLAALICGFVFRSVAVKARNEAMRRLAAKEEELNKEQRRREADADAEKNKGKRAHERFLAHLQEGFNSPNATVTQYPFLYHVDHGFLKIPWRMFVLR